jgi:hypothetical protein
VGYDKGSKEVNVKGRYSTGDCQAGLSQKSGPDASSSSSSAVWVESWLLLSSPPVYPLCLCRS